jgi:outer membrane protein assembly factor BamB
MKITRRAVMQALAMQPIVAAAAMSGDAVAQDWPSFLGPFHNATSTETNLTRRLPPPLLWEVVKGEGYAAPAVAAGRLVLVHRLGDEEVVECLDAAKGTRHWQFRYPTAYQDRYGYNNGPRSSPVITGGRVLTTGAEGKLHLFDIATGKLLWRRDLRADYRVPQDFFGTASTPLVEGGRIIFNVGAPGGPCVVALDLASGKEVWRAGETWGASYASPTPATMHGQRRVFVFAGGESQPPSGGLLCLDPATGRVDFEFPWRSRSYESVNASCPVVFGNKVFISASYRTGSALLDVRPDFTYSVAWRTQEFGLHFTTAVHDSGYLYGFDGRNEPDASLACVDAATGRIVWRETPEWIETVGTVQQTVGPYRASLLKVDGAYLCLGELGHLLWLELRPDGYRQIARARLFAARESWTPLVLSRGRLYVAQNSREIGRGRPTRLLCYDIGVRS